MMWWLVNWSFDWEPDWRVGGSSLSGLHMQCVVSQDKKLYSTLSLSLYVQVYKWVSVNHLATLTKYWGGGGGGTLRWTSMLSRRSNNAPSIVTPGLLYESDGGACRT